MVRFGAKTGSVNIVIVSPLIYVILLLLCYYCYYYKFISCIIVALTLLFQSLVSSGNNNQWQLKKFLTIIKNMMSTKFQILNVNLCTQPAFFKLSQIRHAFQQQADYACSMHVICMLGFLSSFPLWHISDFSHDFCIFLPAAVSAKNKRTTFL